MILFSQRERKKIYKRKREKGFNVYIMGVI